MHKNIFKDDYSYESIYNEIENLGLQNTELHFYSETNSTNTRAKTACDEGELSSGAALFVADSQSAGRGRFGRRFVSGCGTGIYMSLVLPEGSITGDGATLTAYAAVAAAEAIEELSGVSVSIKWVNDLYLSGKKLAGILCEGIINADTGKLSRSIIGIGINVLKTEFPEELRETACDLETESGKRVSRSHLAAKITEKLLNNLSLVGSPQLIEKYKSRSFLIGKRVTVMRGNEAFPSTVIDIGRSAELTVRRDDGAVISLSSGEVSVLPEKQYNKNKI